MSHYIAIDWGSTNLRAWHIRDGKCVDERRSERGVTRWSGTSPEAVFNDITAHWLADEAVPVVMAGMIGSNAGWVEAAYLPCPVALDQLGSRLMPVKENVWIVPGLSVNRPDNHNVMRGEETQLRGAVALGATSLCVMPGTHAKWVQLDGQTVADFRTVMTGELHHLLLKQSLVGAGLPEQQADAQAFRDGVEIGSQDVSILSRLFEVRASHVLGARAKSSISDFLSGLLIGHEVALMQRTLEARREAVTVIGGSQLAERYINALHHVGMQATFLEGDSAFQHGIRSIADELAN
ncbi:2-oxo-3-deoxygalactonate kinase [Enterobacterales bacterium CwR94]|nr:2-oxo-3-deoxygalactonate kinase [Enterobacterales bacterium CwR94]